MSQQESGSAAEQRSAMQRSLNGVAFGPAVPQVPLRSAAAPIIITKVKAATTAVQAPIHDQSQSNGAPVYEKDGKVLHPDLLNPKVLKAQYAVRGELYLRGQELQQQGREIIFTNGEGG